MNSDLNVGLIGYGTVGKGVVKILEKNKSIEKKLKADFALKNKFFQM